MVYDINDKELSTKPNILTATTQMKFINWKAVPDINDKEKNTLLQSETINSNDKEGHFLNQ